MYIVSVIKVKNGMVRKVVSFVAKTESTREEVDAYAEERFVQEILNVDANVNKLDEYKREGFFDNGEVSFSLHYSEEIKID